MRCHKKRSAVLLVVLFLIILYLSGPNDLITATPKRTLVGSLLAPSQLMSSRGSWIAQGNFLPLNVSYQLLAGTPAAQQKFLTIGLASVKRKKDSYLLSTLHSLFNHSSAEERSSMVVVVLLADFDAQWRKTTVGELKTTFALELEQGQLLVIHVPEQYYPQLTGLKRNYNDAAERVSFRSKQNVDYSYLIHFSAGFGSYYLQLEDDVTSSQHFLSAIRKHVQEQNAKLVTWATLEFSTLGYIGKLYRSVDLPLLARFLFLFYQEMPCDWLLTHFRVLLTQKEAILFKPSLFQHIGLFSSFKGTYNSLKDADFEEGVYFNPPADVYSNMSVYKDYTPHLAWAPGMGFFWGRTPETGSHLTVVLRDPVVITGIIVITGLEGRDLLEAAVVELGSDVITNEKGEKTCKRFLSVGNMENGIFEMHEVEAKHGSSPSSCLRIQVTANQKDWAIVRKIRITVKT